MFSFFLHYVSCSLEIIEWIISNTTRLALLNNKAGDWHKSSNPLEKLSKVIVVYVCIEYIQQTSR